MIKNVDKFLKEAKEKRAKYLKSLTLKRGIEILENILTSKLLASFISKRKDNPLSIEKALKHAKPIR